MHPGRRRQTPGMGLMLLFYQLFGVIGIENIPPVTLGVVGLQVAVFLRLFQLTWYKISHVCISGYNVWRKKEFSRLLYGGFEHVDDWHLYYNMLSFAYKGQSLERRFGSVKFLYLIFTFTVLTSTVLVALNTLAGKYIPDFEEGCAVGFSGVIFALKVLTTYYDSNYTHQVMGIPIIIPARYAVWVELILIQLVVSNVSFLGHLAGILVGMAYVYGPLKFILDNIYSFITGLVSSSHPRFTPRAEPTGYSSEKFRDYVPSNMSEEEQLQRAMHESSEEEMIRRAQEENMRQFYKEPYHMSPPSTSYASPPPAGLFRNMPPPLPTEFAGNMPPPPPPGFAPDIEEIRRRRQDHFFNY